MSDEDSKHWEMSPEMIGPAFDALDEAKTVLRLWANYENTGQGKKQVALAMQRLGTKLSHFETFRALYRDAGLEPASNEA